MRIILGLFLILAAAQDIPVRVTGESIGSSSLPSPQDRERAAAANAADAAERESGRRHLEMTRWKVRTLTLGIPHFWDDAELIFRNGMFTSSRHESLGFIASIYESRPSADGFAWSSTQTHPKGEKAEWKGTRMGDKMTGTLVWTHAGGRVKILRWKARLIKK